LRGLRWGVTALLLFNFSLARAVTNEVTSASAAGTPRHIVYGGDQEYPPFEWLDKDGQPEGFNVDLIRAIGKAMGYDVEVRLGPWPRMREALEHGGGVDVSDMFLTKERAKTEAFSAPFWEVHDEIFARLGAGRVNSVDELAGREVLCQQGSAAAELLRHAVPKAKLILVASEPEALRRLALGQEDCAVVTSMAGRYAIRQNDLRNLRASGPPLWPRDYCLVTAKGRPQLLADLNEGLAIVKETGRFDEIYDKWFADVVPRRPWLSRFQALLPWMVIGLAGLAAWIWILRHTVRQRTRELRQSEQRLRLTVEAANVGLWDWDLENNAIWLSPEWKRQIGYEDHEIPNRFEEWQSRVHPGDLDRMLATIKAYHEKPWPDYEVEFRLRHKDGSYRWILAKASLITDGQGKAKRMLGSHLDITERKQVGELLQESETRHRFLFEHNPMPMLIYERGTLQMLGVNDAFKEHYGYSLKEALSLRLPDLYPEEERARITELIPQLHGHANVGEWHHRKRDGSFITNVVFSDDLEYHGRNARVAVMADITERKRMEETLQKSEQQFRLIMENLADLVAVLDLNGCRLYNSPSYQGILGDPAKLRGTSSFDQIHPEDRMRVKQAFEETVRSGVGQRLEYRMVGEDGQARHIESQGSVIRDAQGRVSQVVVVSRDVTERKRAEEKISEVNEDLRVINRIISAMITGVLNLQEILDFALDEALGIVELEGGTICLVSPDERLELAAQRSVSEATIGDLTTNKIKVGEYLCGECARTQSPLILRNRAEVLEYCRRESIRGETIQFHAAFPLVTGGECVGVLSVFTRTEKKPLERRLKLLETVTGQVAMAVQNARLYGEIRRHSGELEYRVAERTAELAVAKERAESADRLKSAFLATMSHELRTPLNSILGFTGIMLQGLAGPLNAEQTKQLGMVQSSSRQLLALINDVLDISKIEAGELKLALAPFDLRATIERSVAAIRPLAESKGLALRLEMSPVIGELVSDGLRVEQILLNLLNNAVKFTERGEVVMSADVVAGTVRVRITDTGIGIKPEDFSKLFRPFQQLASGLSRSHEGTGLGLAICRRLAGLLGGEIQVESEAGKGSTFSVLLPVKGARRQ
jgi:PAS domain S-box-containing protein